MTATNGLVMRTRQLETALTVFAREAATRLQADLDAGAEVPFELTGRSSRGRGPRLYCYQPQTAAFLRERWASLRRLPSHGTALALLEELDGLDRYLLAREAPVNARSARPGRRRAGGPDLRRGGPRADAALLALCEDVFAEQTAFEAQQERVHAAIERLARAVRPDSDADVALLATLHGLALATPELQLATGLSILAPDALPDAPPEALAPAVDEGPDCGQRLLVLYTASDPDALGALARGRDALAEVLRALRLFGDGRIALGPLAWARVGEGGWSARALPHGGRPHGMLVVSSDQEDELRAFCNLIARRAPTAGPIAWALARFELGCARATETEALSDYLLALRALLAADETAPAGGPDDTRVASHPGQDERVASHPGQDERVASHPGQDERVASHPGQDERVASHPGQDERVASHPGQDERVASHPGQDERVASRLDQDDTADLEPSDDAGDGLLAQRLAALCALPDQWPLLARRVNQALALERATIAGTAPAHASADALVRDLANHVRALLRDVVCGHLDADLARVADELIAEAAADAQRPGVHEDEYADEYEYEYEYEPSTHEHDTDGEHDTRRSPGRDGPRARPSGEQVLRDPGQTGEIAHVSV